MIRSYKGRVVMLELVIECCDLSTRKPAEQMSGSGDHQRIYTLGEDGVMTEIFRGAAWSDADFEENVRREGRDEPRDWMKTRKVKPVVKPLA
jgi:hypothetical protein